MEKKIFRHIVDTLITVLSVIILMVMASNIRFDDTRFINIQSFLLTALIFYLSKFADEIYGIFEKENVILRPIGLVLSIIGLAIVLGCYCKLQYIVDPLYSAEYNNSIAFIQSLSNNAAWITGLYYIIETSIIAIRSLIKYYQQK